MAETLQFKAKHVSGVGWFLLVREKYKFSCVAPSRWRRVGLDALGFELYGKDTDRYPMATKEDTLKRKEDYLIWLGSSKGGTRYYDI